MLLKLNFCFFDEFLAASNMAQGVTGNWKTRLLSQQEHLGSNPASSIFFLGMELGMNILPDLAVPKITVEKE